MRNDHRHCILKYIRHYFFFNFQTSMTKESAETNTESHLKSLHFFSFRDVFRCAGAFNDSFFIHRSAQLLTSHLCLWGFFWRSAWLVIRLLFAPSALCLILMCMNREAAGPGVCSRHTLQWKASLDLTPPLHSQPRSFGKALCPGVFSTTCYHLLFSHWFLLFF